MTEEERINKIFLDVCPEFAEYADSLLIDEKIDLIANKVAVWLTEQFRCCKFMFKVKRDEGNKNERGK